MLPTSKINKDWPIIMITKNLKPAIFRERIRDCGASSEVELVTTLNNDNQRGERPMVGLITTPTIY